MRKLATVRIIGAVKAIEGADSICAYIVDGWQVVDAIGKYVVGDKVIYIEPDAWVPHTLAPFLSKGKEPREYKGVKGEKLRSIKIRKTLSQGLLLSIQGCIEVLGCTSSLGQEEDFSDWLGIQLWEREIPAQLSGVMKGGFPSFIRKTDQERIQNLSKQYEKFKQYPIEVTEKLEGSSCSVYFNNHEFGVCSRNIDLKETEDNTFWKVANKYDLREEMSVLGLNIAIQGELVGAGIQGNIYNSSDYDFYVYDVFDIGKQEHMSAKDRYSITESLGLKHVPVLGLNWHKSTTIEDLIEMADGKSELNPKQDREGIVLKALDGSFSFKVISNKYLLSEKYL
jgi:RNA ligase (TIGR02306 family)